MTGNPMAPHVAIVQVIHETYEMQPDGHYNPTRKADGRVLITLKGSDQAVCEARLATFLDTIKKEYENATLESQAEGPGVPQVRGAGGALPQRPPVLGMRSGFAGRDRH